MQPQNPYATPTANAFDINAKITDEQIEALLVSNTWKGRFRAITLAGGVELPNLKNLTRTERSKAIGFNILAFLFGPIYYISKGMWKKGISYFFLACVVIVILSLILDYFGQEKISNYLHYGASAVFSMRANMDFYKKTLLNNNGWW